MAKPRRLGTYRWIGLVAALIVGLSATGSGLLAQRQPQASVSGIAPSAMAQIQALVAEKQARTRLQRKVASCLLHAAKIARGEASAVAALTIPRTADNRAKLDVRAAVTDDLVQRLRALGAEIVETSAATDTVLVDVDVTQVEAIAAIPDVRFVAPRLGYMLSGVQGARTNTGTRMSEGDKTHKADVARTLLGVSGAGVKVGVLSDGVTHLATSQASGDLGAVTVLSGQTGDGDEGTAMLEIVHDLAPNASLYFATGTTSASTFAQNIRALRSAGCDIIVDDIAYMVESPFQDGQSSSVGSTYNSGIIAQAVKEVAADGALYFSSAANSGNLDAGTSGTWEGDFADGGAVSWPESGRIHNFGGQNYTVMTVSSDFVSIAWSDPLGGSANDYDLFRLNSAGTSVLDYSNDMQTGTQDPFEYIYGAAVGDRIVIIRYSGASRFLHLDTNRGRLSIATQGSTHGHAATSAAGSFGVAASPAIGPYPGPFNTANTIETFSSDGPRRIFFTADGVAITAGNFSSTGGQLLNKPDLTAADGVSVTGVGGFGSPFYGTSAAAPHAAAIAALVKSGSPSLSASRIRTALINSAIDVHGAGVDRNSGVGIVMADAAVRTTRQQRTTDTDGDGKSDLTVFRNGGWYTLPSATGFSGGSTTTFGVAGDLPVPGDYDGDGKADRAVYRPSTHTWYLQLSSTGAMAWYLWGDGTDVPVPGDYDGDGKTDVAVYRPSTGIWWIRTSSSNYTVGMTSSVSGSMFSDVPVPGDYDGDSTTDLAVFRPSTGMWMVRQSSTGTVASWQWGLAGDVPVPGDYDGDLATDLAVYRPSNGTWYIKTSSSGFTSTLAYQWGLPGDTPVPGDYDGDGKVDLAVYRGSNGTWFISQSSTGFGRYTAYQWGLAGDVVTPNATVAYAMTAARRTVANVMRNGDFDGDGKADLTVYRWWTAQWFTVESGSSFTTAALRVWGNPASANDKARGLDDRPVSGDFDGDGQTDIGVWRPGNGTWWILTSSSGYASMLDTYSWGLLGDTPVVGDFDGDGKADIAVWRPSEGNWYIIRSSSGTVATYQWGLDGDVPVPGDYDGDGISDLAVFRPSNGTWYIRTSSSGFTAATILQWGLSGDIAVPGDYDGDGTTDIAVYRWWTGDWHVKYSSTSFTTSAVYQWGLNGDIPVPGDYDGDGRIDPAVFRPSTGVWYVLSSRSNYAPLLAQPWGVNGDIPILRRQ